MKEKAGAFIPCLKAGVFPRKSHKMRTAVRLEVLFYSQQNRIFSRTETGEQPFLAMRFVAEPGMQDNDTFLLQFLRFRR